MKKGRTKFWFSLTAPLALCLLSPTTVSASGFRVPEISTAGVATANAIVANSSIAGAMAYNPAIMTYHPDNTLVFGLTKLDFDLSVKTAGTTKNNIGEDSFIIPNIYYVKDISEEVKFGLAVNSPFGLETKWKQGTFPFFATNSIAAFEYEKTKIKMINVNPNFSFEINKNSSFSIGVMHYELLDVVFNTYAFKVRGSGSSQGWNMGYFVKDESVSIGISFKSKVKTELTGTVDGSNTGASKAPGNLNLTLPSILQFGVNYKITPKLAVEFDLERTGWKEFDVIRIKHSSTPTAGLFTNPIVSENNWEDSNTYRFSATYDVNPALELRVGYTRDETPQTASSDFSPRIADNDRSLYSFGAAYNVDDWLIEVSYLLADVDTRVVTTPTKAAGTYNSEATLLSFGVVKSF